MRCLRVRTVTVDDRGRGSRGIACSRQDALLWVVGAVIRRFWTFVYVGPRAVVFLGNIMGFKGEGFGGNKDIAIYEASVVTYISYGILHCLPMECCDSAHEQTR